MKTPGKATWLRTGTVWQRLGKESLVIFPFALILVYYYAFMHGGQVEFTVSKLLLVSGSLTLAIAAFNARKRASQPSAKKPRPGSMLVPHRN
jgi:hypothetical protein